MDLMEYLWVNSGTTYLSDLNAVFLPRNLSHRVLAAIRKADPARWPLREWKDAVTYMTGGASCPDSAEECRTLLLRDLEGLYDALSAARRRD